MTLPITIIIRTLNEEENIDECIKSCLDNNVDEIIIVDGYSMDNTESIVKNIMDKFDNVKFIKIDKGLVTQRDIGIKKSNKNNLYIAIVDADDRLDKNCMKNLIEDLKRHNADAVQAKHKSYEFYSGVPLNYWEKAMDINLKIINLEAKNTKDLNMVGRPALYARDLLVKTIFNSKQKFTTAHEDADLSYNLIKNKAKFTFGTGVTYRKHLDSFFKLYKRWLSYGSGDAKFIIVHRDRVFNVIYHLLINYPIIRSFKAIKKGYILYIPFFILQGIIRFMGMMKYFIFGIGNIDNYKK